MNTNRPGPLVHAGTFMLSVAMILTLSRAASLLLPVDFYFTFESLFSDRTPRQLLIALIMKMGAPLLVGAIYGLYLYRKAVRSERSHRPFSRTARRLRMQWMPTLFMAGFSAALLSAWPMIVYWDIMANPLVAHLKMAFYLLYLVYMIAFGYVSVFGLLGAIYLREQFDGLPEGRKAVTAGELSRVGALWLLSSGLASGAMSVLTK